MIALIFFVFYYLWKLVRERLKNTIVANSFVKGILFDLQRIKFRNLKQFNFSKMFTLKLSSIKSINVRLYLLNDNDTVF
jgi:hypothetical protein